MSEAFGYFSRSCQVLCGDVSVEVGWSQEQETFYANFREPEDRDPPLEPLGWELCSYHSLEALVRDTGEVLRGQRGITEEFRLEPSLFRFIAEGMSVKEITISGLNEKTKKRKNEFGI